mgnify:CR=1 FL=1
MDALAIHAVNYTSPAAFKIKRRETPSDLETSTKGFGLGDFECQATAITQPTFLECATIESDAKGRSCTRPVPVVKDHEKSSDDPVRTKQRTPKLVSFANSHVIADSPNRMRSLQKQVSSELGSNSELEALSLDSGTISKSKSTISFLDLKIDEQMTNAYKIRAARMLPDTPTRRSRSPSLVVTNPSDINGDVDGGLNGDFIDMDKAESLDAVPEPKPTIPLEEIIMPLMDGLESIVDDGFQKCFERREERSWNWNWYLFVPWCFGVLLRNFVFFPIRLVVWILGHFLFVVFFALGSIWFASFGDKSNKKEYEVQLVKYLASVYVVSWSGVVKFHGIRPEMQKQVFVANHTTMTDTAILLQHNIYSLVGQMHSSVYVSFVQKVAMRSMNCVWFNRGDNRDRAKVAQTLTNHAHNVNGDLQPLLIFPEGTCVNNDFVVQFKKTVFDLDRDIAICPIAIKYNKSFVDAYWISSQEGFLSYLFRLMRSFCLVCDVWYMDPMYRAGDETAIQFAARVQKAVADRAGLTNTDYDGYMKYWTPSLRYKRARQLAFAHQVVPRSFITGYLKRDDEVEDEKPDSLDNVVAGLPKGLESTTNQKKVKND